VNSAEGPWNGDFSIETNPSIGLDNLVDGQTVTVYVKGKNSAGRWQTNPDFTASKTWSVHISSSGVTRSEASDPSREFKLNQNVPNPFNPLTVIEFGLPETADITLTVLDARGRRVADLVSGRFPAGKFKSVWDARDFPAGVYYGRLHAGDLVKTIKMSLVK
jgi:hypothetical protein